MSKILRGYLVVVSFIIFGFATLIMGYVCFPLIKLFNRDKKKRLFMYGLFVRTAWYIFVGFLKLIRIIAVKSNDIEKLKNIKNSVIVTTHPSFIDGLVLLSIIPDATCLVAGRLAENWLTQNIVKSMFIISGVPVEDIIAQTDKMLDNDLSVMVFPSGKRHLQNEYPKIRKGAALIAMNADKDIIPIKLTTNIPFLQIGEPVSKPLEKTVEYTIEVKETIKIEEFTKKYEDEFIRKRELTKAISEKLYGK